MDARDYVVGVVTSSGNVEGQSLVNDTAPGPTFLTFDAARSWARHLRRKLGLRAVVIQSWDGNFVAGDVVSVWGLTGRVLTSGSNFRRVTSRIIQGPARIWAGRDTMAIKFEKIQAGMTLYARSRQRRGNTTLRYTAEHEVYVKEVNAELRTALVSWNGNKAEWRGARQLERYFKSSMKRAGRD